MKAPYVLHYAERTMPHRAHPPDSMLASPVGGGNGSAFILPVDVTSDDANPAERGGRVSYTPEQVKKARRP